VFHQNASGNAIDDFSEELSRGGVRSRLVGLLNAAPAVSNETHSESQFRQTSGQTRCAATLAIVGPASISLVKGAREKKLVT